MDRNPEADLEPSRPLVPAWLWVLAGWLLASTQIGDGRLPISEREIRERAPFAALDPPTADPDRMDLRELRRLPAIGPARASAIARARWEQGLEGGPEAWDAVPGIGEETIGAIRRFLERSGTRP